MSKRIFIGPQEIPAEALASDVIFDTNVWLRVQGCLIDSVDIKTKVYSLLFRKLLEEQRTIYINQTIVSEFVNASLTILARQDGWSRDQCKIHQHPQYADWMGTVSDDVSYVIEDCSRVADNFDNLPLEECLSHCKGNAIDFNDVLIRHTCQLHRLVLVTDDGDFAGEDVPIITMRRKAWDRGK